MTQHVDTSTKTFVAGEALEPYRRVKLTGAQIVSYADVGEDAIGATVDRVASGDLVAIRLFRGSTGTFELESAGAVTQNADVYGAADGKIDDIPAGARLGQAIISSAGAAEVIEVVLCQSDFTATNPTAIYGDVVSGGVAQALHELSATANYPLGTKAVDAFGEVYRYAYMSGQHHPGFGSYNVGKVNISGAAPAQTAAGLGAIGSTLVKVTVGGSGGFAANGAVAANELVGGCLVINNGNGGELLMQNRRITANTVVAIGGGTCTVTIDMPLTVAVTVSTSNLEVLLNPFAHLIGGLTSPNAKATFLGLPVAAALNQYGWIKRNGLVWICPVPSGEGAPGYTAGDRVAYFASNGSIVSGTTTVIESGKQKAGNVVENSTDGVGPPIIQMIME
jgi:hypothetical protein